MFRSDIGMTFGLAKCGHLIVNRGEVKSTSEISLPEGRIDNINKSSKYFEILKTFGNNEKEICCKTIYLNRNGVRQVLKSKLSGKNKVTAINTSGSR